MNYTEKELVVDGVKVLVRRPILSVEERKKREDEICNALANFFRAIEERSNENV